MAIMKRKRKTDGVTVYEVDFRDQHGRRVRETAGTTRKQAQRVLERRIGEVRAGTYVNAREAARLAAERRGPTFAALADSFLQEYAVRCRSDYYSQLLGPERVTGKRLRPAGPLRRYFADKLAREITPADLDKYRVHCLQVEGLGPSTTRKRLIALGTLFKMARRWGVVEVNPAADLEKPSEPHHRERFLTAEEYEALRKHADPWLRPLLTVAVLTGMRLKEVVGLRWQDVDRDGGRLYVSEDCKTGRPRYVAMAPTVRGVLDALGGMHLTDGHVFTTADGAPLTSTRNRNRITQRTKAAAKAAGLDAVTFHTLRHTAGSWMAQAGQSPVHIAKMLGHAATSTTDRYMHLVLSDLRPCSDALEAAIRPMVTPVETRPQLHALSASPALDGTR